ncbi:hypothetical protein ABS735_30085 [Streptomyces sp. MMCC 100]|uniref:hypothetical protein n=1 Tax=Streptomyces sp. MMCC 100 TaxID=3163555 RepID=UPI003597E54C
MQAQVDACGHARGRQHVAVVDEQDLLVDLDPGIMPELGRGGPLPPEVMAAIAGIRPGARLVSIWSSSIGEQGRTTGKIVLTVD